MIVRKFSSFFDRRRSAPRRRPPRYFLPVDAFGVLLHRERMRSDRSGAVFSLVAIELDEQERRRGGVRRLAEVMEGRLRATDVVGFLEDGRIGALLPETPPEGAWTAADDLVAQYPTGGSPPRCEVYAYPSDDHCLPDDFPKAGIDREQALLRSQPLELLFARPLPGWKRAMDVLGALVGLVLAAPILAATAIAIKATSGGPVLFRQWRTGRGGVPFLVYKFRTMVADAEIRKAGVLHRNERDGPAFKMERDPRVTRLGRFLRRSSLDELPQLWNVLCGSMSLVGPRPLPCDEAAQCAPWQRWRHDVTPGLTCIWQVKGRSEISFAEWMRMDRRYTNSVSFSQDILLLAKTVPAVVSGRGAS